jgi:hypothetical protein
MAETKGRFKLIFFIYLSFNKVERTLKWEYPYIIEYSRSLSENNVLFGI